MYDVLDFISNFHGSEDVFLHGCCYWFARILFRRFNNDKYIADICYEPVEGHFITIIIDRNNLENYMIADVRGDVTDKYMDSKFISIEDLRRDDRKYYDRLMRDCRDFIRPSDEDLYVE